ncbi:MAG: response regulator [Candidatus Omnitrophica bacterium]|nr:response regulator [Candidatus Omnitrophota bacterium]
METETRGRILIVEDDDALARITRLRLESEGYSVHTEPNGANGLTYAADHPVDLVILDLRLPDMSGYDVCKQLRRIQHPWAVPVLMLTALQEPVDQLKGFVHGADAYLTKPCEPEELLRTISRLLGEMTTSF